jgi:hypothetical protein
MLSEVGLRKGRPMMVEGGDAKGEEVYHWPDRAVGKEQEQSSRPMFLRYVGDYSEFGRRAEGQGRNHRLRETRRLWLSVRCNAT